jgi:hypothetical protein
VLALGSRGSGTAEAEETRMRGDFDEDEIDDFEPDFTDEDDLCADCGRIGSHWDVCGVCGAPMCSACFEMGCGVCRLKHE